MKRFPCHSKLILKPDLTNRPLNIVMHHDYHTSYLSIRPTQEVLDYISSQCLKHTPAEIYQDLQGSQIPGADEVVQYQVCYQWQCVNSKMWKRDNDPFVFASKFIDELGPKYQHSIYTSGNLRGLAIYIRGTMTALVSKARELVIDATYGTNNSGMSLFAVLAELDGTGVPLCYLFLGTKSPDECSKSAQLCGATISILENFLQPLKAAEFGPTFFGCDKDRAEISAIRQVWPRTTVQLCYWHAKIAIRKKLKDGRKTSSQKNYNPEEAKSLVPSLEICWGTCPTSRPHGDHRYGRCQCISNRIPFSELGRLETGNVAERDVVLNIFSRHFNMHPMIPDQNGTYRSAEQIHFDCINELYVWCRTRNYFRLWAYLYTHWYSNESWKLWARSANPNRVPVLKTTMIIESHWRRIKHDYLHRFNRPRIDLVCWVLVSRVIPRALEKMTAIQKKDHRKATAAWRKAFKRQWKCLRNSRVETEDLLKYHTDPSKWTCACNSFLLSRFLLCKHIVSCFEEVPDVVRFFSEIRRQRSCPFWIEDQLVIRPELKVQETTVLDDAEFGSNAENESDSDTDSETGDNWFEDAESEKEIESENEGISQDDITDFISKMTLFVDTLKEQNEKGNTKLLKELKSQSTKNLEFITEVERQKRQKTMPKTWSKNNKNPGTMLL